MMAGTGRFCTRINAALPGTVQIKTGAEGVFLWMLPTLGLGIALKMWDGAARARRGCDGHTARPSRRVARRPEEELLHPPVKNVVGLLVGEMRPARVGWGDSGRAGHARYP